MPLALHHGIETARLLTRLVTEADLPALLDVNRDDAVTRYLPYASWRGMDDARSWYARMNALQATGTALQFAVLDKLTGHGAGQPACCSATRKPAPAPNSAMCWGARTGARATCTKPCHGLVDCAFGELQLRRLEAEVDPRNSASTRVLDAARVQPRRACCASAG